MVRKIKIDKERCIGCGLCTSISGANFEMADNKARVKENVKKIDEAKEAMASCPNRAITFS